MIITKVEQSFAVSSELERVITFHDLFRSSAEPNNVVWVESPAIEKCEDSGTTAGGAKQELLLIYDMNDDGVTYWKFSSKLKWPLWNVVEIQVQKIAIKYFKCVWVNVNGLGCVRCAFAIGQQQQRSTATGERSRITETCFAFYISQVTPR